MAAVEITRKDLSASERRLAATKTASAKPARRILAIAMVLDGHDRTLAAQAGGALTRLWATRGSRPRLRRDRRFTWAYLFGAI